MKSQEIYPTIARKTIIEAVENDVVDFDELFRYLMEAHKAIFVAEEEIIQLKKDAEIEKYWDEEKFNERVAEQSSCAVACAEEEKDEEIEKIKKELEEYKDMFESSRKLILEQKIKIGSLEELVEYWENYTSHHR